MAGAHEELTRYHRQMLLPGVGEEGQTRLLCSHALIVGCGALGTVIADALCRAGVGMLTVIDRDVVEWTNLQRQTLFDEVDAREGTPKAVAAAARLRRINSGVCVAGIVADFAPLNAEEVMTGGREEQAAASVVGAVNLVLDGTDNFSTRYLINDLCVKRGVPYVYGGAVGTRGMQATLVPGFGPCLRCLFPELPGPGSAETCDTAGVLGPVAGIVGLAQATDALKIMLGRKDLLSGTLLEFDAWANARRRIDLKGSRDPACPCCVLGQFEFLSGARSDDVVTLCGGGQRLVVQVSPVRVDRHGLDLAALAARLASVGKFEAGAYTVRGEIDPAHAPGGEVLGMTVFRDGRAMFRGVRDAMAARVAYARFVGS